MKEKLNFTLDPLSVEVIDMISEEFHISRSSALNYIILDYAQYKAKIDNGYAMVQYKANIDNS